MRILPVIDLLDGCVVRGIAGKRETYRPIASRVAADASPASVAAAFVSEFGFREAYVADLNAIAGRAPAWEAYEAIAAAGLRLWIDAGVASAESAHELLSRASPERLVVGLESLRDTSTLAHLAHTLPIVKLVFSLDLNAGRPLTTIAAWREASPLAIAAAAHDAGFRRLIVLDLARVGMGEGTGTSEICRNVHSRWPDVERIAGGGVSSAAELQKLADDGLDYTLVASALHDGRLTRADVDRWTCP